jgi:hypothetical protein
MVQPSSLVGGERHTDAGAELGHLVDRQRGELAPAHGDWVA